MADPVEKDAPMSVWIELGDGTSARWGEVPAEKVDAVLAYAERVMGRPDTLT